MKRFILFYSSLLSFQNSFCQQEEDSLKLLDEVIIKAFEQNKKQSVSAAIVKIIDFNNGDRHNKTSLVNGFNTVAGVRMEERSPGSYRINIRGSSLRSPFGVRNVKVYWNNLPVTDPGGNTYFNQFAWNNFSSIEIFKGPAASMYGAGTGGLILMETLTQWQPGASIEYVTGSYNVQNLFITGKFGKNDNKSQVSFAHNQSDGYRTQSRMGRDNFSWVSKANISDKQQISFALLLTDLYYQTPGALTLAEFKNNPRNARPAAGAFPSAVAAKAAIEQMNLLAGLTHGYKFTPSFSNYTTFYGSYVQLKNPAIRNYEKRSEPSLGARTVFTYEKKKENMSWQLTGGAEFQDGFFSTSVFKNVNGIPDSLITDDDIQYKVNSFFLQNDLSWNDKWFLTTGLGLNKTKVTFTRLNRFPIASQTRNYRNELAPRISLKKIFAENISVSTTVSRGYSPPTIAELLPSNGVISTDLEAEYGWNYETTVGYNKTIRQHRLQLEVTGFYFKLNNALVQRRDVSGADFFVNAGDVKQKGIEFHADYLHFASSGSVINNFNLRLDYTFNHFRYGSFIKGVDDFSGKTVPSVPANTISALGDINFKNGFYSNITYYVASEIFLNDANAAKADAYHLLGLRLGWKKSLQKNFGSHNAKLNIYAGADNLLNETYSLGNDINAAANRFYNAAAKRNYYVGISFQWVKLPIK